MMKITTKFISLVFALTLLYSISLSAVSQNNQISFKINDQGQRQFESKYMLVHDQYKQKLDPVSKIYTTNITSRDNDWLYLLNVATNYPVFGNPKQYIYTYSLDGFKESTLVKEFNGGIWNIHSFETCSYDTVGNILTSQWRTWQDGTLKNSSNEIFTYNANSQILTYIQQAWENSSWLNVNRGTYIYNGNADILSVLIEEWDGVEWINSSFEVYTYDASGNLVTAVGSVWALGTYWLTERQLSYSYDANGNMISGLTEMWMDTIWTNYYQESYTYNTANNRVTFNDAFWENNTWVNNSRIDYSYDVLGFLTTSVTQNWNNSNWVNQLKEQYYYNMYGSVETVITDVWDTDAWVSSTLLQYTFDQYGNATNGEFFNWVDGDWGHTLDGLIRIYYNLNLNVAYFTGYLTEVSYISLLVDVDEVENKNVTGFTCLPNPASTSTIISTNLVSGSAINISIYNISGKKIQTIYNGELGAGNHNFNVKTESLSAGVYIAKLVTKSTTKSLKIIIKN